MKRFIMGAGSFPVSHALVVALLALVASALMAGPAWAQAPEASPLEMRHFWHVFIAYALAWVLIGGWLFTIVRRLRKVEERLR
jgi:CcmD family protein